MSERARYGRGAVKLCEFRHQHPASDLPAAVAWFELDLGVYVIAFALCPDCVQYVRGGVA